ncbi:hypothetical protein AAG906_023137 [Vitis piasezkii]
MATSDWEDDWELCNDDGFVYKRKKRRLDAVPVAPAPPLPDPQAEEDHRRERKKRALIKIKEKYQREIDHWEHLSNTLRAMEETAHQQQRRQQHEQASSSLPLADSPSSEFVCRTLVDELLLQAEAQEAIIHDVSNLCDVAEAMYNVQDEQLKQSFIDLPIWGSPRKLMASLCDE